MQWELLRTLCDSGDLARICGTFSENQLMRHELHDYSFDPLTETHLSSIHMIMDECLGGRENLQKNLL